MEHTSSRIHKDRRGISTVLGMLIFIGVLFTSVIPLFLYVNKVNSIYDQTVHEMSNIDLERTQERCDAFAYPLSNTSDYLNVYIRNKCALDVKIERVWVNNIYYELENATAPAMDQCYIKNINIGQLKKINGTILYIKVVSTRGKSYSSLTNPIVWNGTSWVGSTRYNIQVVIESKLKGNQKYSVNVTGPGFSEVREAIKASHDTSVTISIHVPNEGRYYITVKNIGKGGSILYPIPPYIDIDFETNPKSWSYCFET